MVLQPTQRQNSHVIVHNCHPQWEEAVLIIFTLNVQTNIIEGMGGEYSINQIKTNLRPASQKPIYSYEVFFLQKAVGIHFQARLFYNILTYNTWCANGIKTYPVAYGSLRALCRMSARLISPATVFPGRPGVKKISSKSDEQGSVKNSCKSDRLYISQTSTSSFSETISAYLPFFNKTKESRTFVVSFIGCFAAVLVNGHFAASNSWIRLTTWTIGLDGERRSRFTVWR